MRISTAGVAAAILIAAAYGCIFEEFPRGAGATWSPRSCWEKRWGVISGSAPLIDYVLTITVLIAAAGDALFSFLPMGWHQGKAGFEIFCIAAVMTLNMRGIKEPVKVLLPIFPPFLGTHVILLAGGIPGRAAPGFGIGAMALLFLHAYSLGGGTYTGIEAVSNGMPIMQEPRVRNGKRTMLYMATSLAITSAGLEEGRA